MKIALFDTNHLKFTRGMIDYWRATGHEVKAFHTTHADYIPWADTIWCDCVDQNLICLTAKIPEQIEGKRIIARAIDIDVWANHFNAVDWSKVDDLIFIAPHIRDRLLSKKTLPGSVRVHLVPCGVDLAKFTLRREPAYNRHVAVVMRLWYGKGIDLLVQAILENPEFDFHICGQWGLHAIEDWYRCYIAEMLSGANNWTHVERVDDMNEWLEDKAYALVCSKKEAFSYAAGEAAAKGLRPLIHTFYGHNKIWPREWCWQTLQELREKLRSPHTPYTPAAYRAHVRDNYSFIKMMEAFDGILAR